MRRMIIFVQMKKADEVLVYIKKTLFIFTIPFKQKYCTQYPDVH